MRRILFAALVVTGASVLSVFVAPVFAQLQAEGDWKAMNTLCQPGEFKPGSCRNVSKSIRAMCLDRSAPCDARSETDNIKNGRICFDQQFSSDQTDCDAKANIYRTAILNAAEGGFVKDRKDPQMLWYSPVYCCVRGLDSNKTGAVTAFAKMDWRSTKPK